MKMKKLLASALAAAMVFTSMVSTIVASADTTSVGTISAGTVDIEVGATTFDADITIDFDPAVLAPHNIVTIKADGYTLDSVTVKDVIKTTDSAEGTITVGEDGANGANYAEGKVLLEAPVDSKAPTVSQIVLTATFVEDDTANTAGTYTITVSGDDMTNKDLADLAITATNGVVNVHGAADAVDYDNTNHWNVCAIENCDLHKYNEAAHTLGDYVANEDGTTETATCTATCGYSVTQDIVADECDHTDDNQDGICDTCDYENLDATLTFYNKAMVLGADIRGIYQVRKIKASSPYESFKVIVEKTDGTVSELELVATSDKTNYTTYGYAITVAAKEMADSMNARIVGITAEGEAFISNVDTWSIKQGLISLMDTYSTQTTEAYVNRVKLCANMLNYGAEAQKNFGYKVENLATDGLSDEYAAYIDTETPEMAEIPATDDTGATAPLKDIVFNLAARVQILPRFTVPKADAKEDYSAVITQVHTAPDGTVTTKEFTIDGATCLKSNTTFAVYVDTLASNELRDVLTVTLYKNGEAVSATHTFSAESVLVGMLETKGSLVTALMNYGDSARAVFG